MNGGQCYPFQSIIGSGGRQKKKKRGVVTVAAIVPIILRLTQPSVQLPHSPSNDTWLIENLIFVISVFFNRFIASKLGSGFIRSSQAHFDQSDPFRPILANQAHFDKLDLVRPNQTQSGPVRASQA